ncbi:MAG: hypothetical protein HY613_09395 [Candidatus Rokubacteria bacterium]|nr:hypothetical protein [Candidatus Rokubacteria bacterium]
MLRDPHIEALILDLIRAIEASLAASEAARAAVGEILKRGVDSGSLLPSGEAGPPLTLTAEDRAFLSRLSIRAEDR